MTKPDTSPSALDRKILSYELREDYLKEGKGIYLWAAQTIEEADEEIRVISATLEAAEMSAKHWHARAEAAEAEVERLREALARNGGDGERADLMKPTDSEPAPDHSEWNVALEAAQQAKE